MSLSSYIQRQSRVTRRTTSISTAAALSSIQEETESLPSNNVKAKRRQGVSDLRIPRNDDEWRLTLSSFPRPPGDEGESSGSSSGSDSECSSGLLTTPTPSPTAESYEVAHATEAQCIIRCKSIKPLRVAKRSVSPLPPPPPPAVEEDHAWIDDDDFYAAHAAGYITLAAPLPPSFPVPSAPVTSSAAVRAANRESAIIPPTAVAVRPSTQLDPTYSRRLSRRVSIPSRAPPPPPIITSHRGHSRSASSAAVTPGYDVPNFSRPTSLRPPPSRPPPRTPVPCDATWSGEFDFADEYASYAPLLSSPSPSPVPSSSRSSVHRHFPAETQDIPSDVAAARDDEDEWEEYDVSYDGHHNAGDDIPLSPLVAASPVPDSPVRPRWPSPAPSASPSASARPADSPSLPPYQGWHPRPRASVLREALAREPILPLRVPSPTPSPSPSLGPASPPAPAEPKTPILRSRWSSSTLSSVHSAHARSPVASPKTNFSFARRYFPSHSPKSSYSPSPASTSSSKQKPKQRAAKPKPKPMGANQALYHPRPRKKPLTVADVHVVVVGRPPAGPSVLGAACASPDVFGSMAMPMPMPHSSSPAAAYPPSPAPALRRRSRASSLSSSSSWSPTPSVGGSSASDAGSECSGSVASAGSGEGLRRKPIPVEMFIR